MLLEDNLNPGEKVDLDAPKTHVDLWARMRAGMAMPELDNDLVRKAEDWYSSRPDYVARMTGRGSLYLYHVVEEVQKRGMPMELALLPFVERVPQRRSVQREGRRHVALDARHGS